MPGLAGLQLPVNQPLTGTTALRAFIMASAGTADALLPHSMATNQTACNASGISLRQQLVTRSAMEGEAHLLRGHSEGPFAASPAQLPHQVSQLLQVL